MSYATGRWAVAVLVSLSLAQACGDDGGSRPMDATVDGRGASDGGAGTDGGTATDAASVSDAAPTDAAPTDAASEDAGGADAGVVYHYDCGAFSEAAGWTVRSGFRAVVVADSADGLSQPVALTFAEGAFGGKLFAVCQGDDSVRRIDVGSGAVDAFVEGAAWGTPAPGLLTTIAWDEEHVFDGNLYVGDQGGDGDNDSIVFKVTASGAATRFAMGPGAGFDDIYGLAFAPSSSAYTAGLYVTGDTDGAGVDWGRVSSAGAISAFSEVTGIEGIAWDPTGLYGGSIWASRPGGGGYAGDGSLTPIDPSGGAGAPLVTGRTGVHAVTFSTGGAFGARMFAADWNTNELLEVSPSGTVTVLASGLALTNYDGNILAASSDGQVLFVADRLANRVVCIEPVED